MGTCGKFSNINLSKLLLKGDILLKGNMHRSKIVKKKIIKTEPYISADANELEQYLEDPLLVLFILIRLIMIF